MLLFVVHFSLLSSIMIFVDVTFVWKFLNIHVLVQFGGNPLGIYSVLVLLEAIILIFIRPPVYGSNGRTYKMLVMFSFFLHAFSEFPRPIALKLCHLIGICVYFLKQVQKLGGHSPQKIWGP